MDAYFKSYGELDTHQLMLSDKERVSAYKTAIFNSKEKFQDKIVMDIGAGSGILSIFCVQAGARKVYAVEASILAESIEQVLIENNVQNKVEIIHSKVEDIRPDSLEKIDIIVSEWMGFYLVHEGMLDSVIFARNNFLHEDGLLFPSIAKLYAAPCQLPSMYEFWNNICGVSMRYLGKEYRKSKALKPEVLLISEDDILTEEILIAWLDLKYVSMEEINVLGRKSCVSVCENDGRFQGMCIWFEVEFPDGSELSTGPYSEATHWKQTAIVLPEDIEVTKNEPIAFKLELKRNPSYPRRYNIELSLLNAEEVEHDAPCNCHLTKCIVIKKYLKNLCGNTTENNDL